MKEFDRIKVSVDKIFNIKDLGLLKNFLDLEVTHSKEEIYFSHRKYCLDLLQEYGLLGSKPDATPLDSPIKLHVDNGKSFKDIGPYKRLIGCLLYLNTTIRTSYMLHISLVNSYTILQ